MKQRKKLNLKEEIMLIKICALLFSFGIGIIVSMLIYCSSFFIHEFGELKSSNLIFTIPSSLSQAGARGDIETLMISIIIKDEEDGDPKVFQESRSVFQ